MSELAEVEPKSTESCQNQLKLIKFAYKILYRVFDEKFTVSFHGHPLPLFTDGKRSKIIQIFTSPLSPSLLTFLKALTKYPNFLI